MQYRKVIGIACTVIVIGVNGCAKKTTVISAPIATISEIAEEGKASIYSTISNADQKCEFKYTVLNESEIPKDFIEVYTNIDCTDDTHVETLKYIEKNKGMQTLTIAPLSGVLDASNNSIWGYADTYYIKIKYDDNFNELSEPIIIPFNVKMNIESPVAEAVIDSNAQFKLAWRTVSGATQYRIYKLTSDSEKPVLLDEVDGDTCEWCDFNLDKTNGIGNVSGDTVLYQNNGIDKDDIYCITAIDEHGNESRYSNEIKVSNYANLIAYSIDDNSILKNGNYTTTVKELPRSVYVNMADGSKVQASVEYKLDESTRYSDNVYYTYNVIGTHLKGFIEVKVQDASIIPTTIHNGVQLNKDSFDFNISVLKSRHANKKVVDLNDAMSHNTESKQIGNGDGLQHIKEELLNYSANINLSEYSELHNYQYLAPKLQEMLYQNPTIYGVKSIIYDEDDKTLMVSYKDKVSELKEKQSYIINAVNDINKNDEKEIYDYLNSEYAYSKTGDIYNLLKNKKGNSVAYSQLFKMLLDKNNVENRIVVGNLSGSTHTWNEITASGQQVYTDATNNLTNTGLMYACYNMDTESACKMGYLANMSADSAHSKDSVTEYYRVNKLVASNSDEYFNIIDSAVADGKDNITVRYTGEEISSDEIVSRVCEIFKKYSKQDKIAKLHFGDGLGYYILWYDSAPEIEQVTTETIAQEQ